MPCTPSLTFRESKCSLPTNPQKFLPLKISHYNIIMVLLPQTVHMQWQLARVWVSTSLAIANDLFDNTDKRLCKNVHLPSPISLFSINF